MNLNCVLCGGEFGGGGGSRAVERGSGLNSG
jgi:hypothetical protein